MDKHEMSRYGIILQAAINTPTDLTRLQTASR